MAKIRKVAKRAGPKKSGPKAKPSSKPVRAKKAKPAHMKKTRGKMAKKPAKKTPLKKAPKPVPAPPGLLKPGVPVIEMLPPPPPGQITPEEEKKPVAEGAPQEEKPEEAPLEEKIEEKEAAIAPEEAPAEEKPEEAPPEEKPEEEAHPEEEKKRKKELTPEEKIDLMFPEEKPESEEEKPEEKIEEGLKEEAEEVPAEEEAVEKPEKEPEEIPAEEEKAEEKPEEIPVEGEAEEKPEEAPAEEIPPEEEAVEKPEEEPEKALEGIPPEEKPEAAIEEEKPGKKRMPPPRKPAEEKAAPAPAAPLFAMLPAWEDRRRLRKVIEEEGFEFSTPAPGSRDFREALKLLAKYRQADTGGSGYALVCVRDRAGKLAGATDGYVAAQVGATVLVIGRSVVFAQDKRKDLHMIMHGALLEAAKPTHVACCTGRPNLSKAEDVGKLIFFGRGLGMSAIPVNHPRLLCFLRCVGNEHNPRISGKDAAMVLAAVNKIQDDDALGSIGAELSGRESVTLVMLPASPDPGEHMHELKDAVLALGLPTNQFDSAFDSLESQYLRGRADITPASLF